MAHAPRRLGLSPGRDGSPISVITNFFAVTNLPKAKFTHYDGKHNFLGGLERDLYLLCGGIAQMAAVEFPEYKELPKRDRALQIIEKLQYQEAALFNPRAAYDGQRNMFRTTPLNLPNNAAVFRVFMGDTPAPAHAKAKGVAVKVTRVAVVDPNSILAVIRGQSGYSSESLTTLTMLNILIRMGPIMSYPSNARSFFTKDRNKNLGGGLEVWRGFFQSVRPTLDRLLVNIDTATAVMYNSGLLIDLALGFLNLRNIRDLSPAYLSPVAQSKLNKFLAKLLVSSSVPAKPGRSPRHRRISNIVTTGADHYQFTNDTTGENMTITEYFYKAYQYRVRYGDIICVDVGRGIVYPMEVLQVKEGQIYRKVLPPALAPDALKFSTQKPVERMQAIQRGTRLLGYADSDFIRQSGMAIDERLISINARVLPAPPIQWGGNRRPDAPKGGAWNVLGKQLYHPGHVRAWAVVVYDTYLQVNQTQVFVKMFRDACVELGMTFPNRPPAILTGRPGAGCHGHHGVIVKDMDKAAREATTLFADQFKQEEKKTPTFILVVLPDSAIDIRTSVKNWGDCIYGCATQCMKSGKLSRANNQYCNNLALKVNAKIGGVNSIPLGSEETMRLLSKVPTMVVGADVSHAAPDTDRPSIAGLVSSVDENFCRYVACTKVQQQREEIIADLDSMIENAIQKFRSFWASHKRNVLPYRIIFYRDGVSEGQFKEVGEKEVKQIKAHLTTLWKTRNLSGPVPKLTFIIVAKRHHVRFFPKDTQSADKSGNCPPGLVVDQEIVSPVEYDFYLQSHGGLLGTSRPSHYSVIEDANDLSPDLLQAISYTLCHVYARATRSVSIPAPVYYADIVCARGRFHSRLIHDGGDSAASVASGEKISLEEHQAAFQELAGNMENTMYFM